MRLGATPMARASDVWLRSIGRKNSFIKISPGCGFGNCSAVIVDDLDILRAGLRPSEADAPLVIDANTPLSCTIPFQRLETVARRHAQIIQSFCCVQQTQLAKSDCLDVIG